MCFTRQPLVTTYSYNSATGELTSVDYSDSTTDLAYTYNRLGQTATVTDAAGSRTFTYNANLQLTSEAISGIYTKTVGRSYDTIGRASGVSIGTEYGTAYAYDTYGRLSTVTNGADVFTYGYLANSDLVSTLTMPNSITSTKSYESARNLLTSVENKYGTTTISKYDYANDDISRRTSMAKSGTAFTQADTISYLYNDRSEVTSATALNQTTYNYGFTFDPIGNRLTSASSESGTPVTRSYTANTLNQYTAVNNPTLAPTYDDDGDMLNNGSWTYTWDAENRLATAVSGTTTIIYKYDYMSRRIEKQVMSGESVVSLERFVYDNYKQIERLDGSNSNAVLQKFVWSGETLLCLIDATNSTTHYYLQDANKNITELLDGSGNLTAHYEYSPFGKTSVLSGSYSTSNPFRFSSEFADDETSLVYYNYRYYSPDLGRWLSRDPIEEYSGYNLYSMIDNLVINAFDILGLEKFDPNKECVVTIAIGHNTDINNMYSKENAPNFPKDKSEVIGIGCRNDNGRDINEELKNTGYQSSSLNDRLPNLPKQMQRVNSNDLGSKKQAALTVDDSGNTDGFGKPKGMHQNDWEKKSPSQKYEAVMKSILDEAQRRANEILKNQPCCKTVTIRIEMISGKAGKFNDVKDFLNDAGALYGGGPRSYKLGNDGFSAGREVGR